jgi:hypothetical protein
MSPELRADKPPFDIEKCDTFSLGLTILQLIFGTDAIKDFN